MILWLFIWRLNPPHIWHINIIKRALKENKEALVLLWTPFLLDKNNPFSFNTRKKMLQKISPHLSSNKGRGMILEIKDEKDDIEWIKNIEKILKNNYPEYKNINFYWGDFENDSAFKILKKYEKEFLNCTFNYIEKSRTNSIINHNWKEYLISSTNFRKSLNNKNYNLASKFSDENIFEEIKKEFI
jgi:cytidyltransferase-like protein